MDIAVGRRLAIAAGLVVGMAGAPALAEDAGNGGTRPDAPMPYADSTIRAGGELTHFRSVSNAGATATSSTSYVEIPEMRLVVNARRRSRLLITFTAECRAEPLVVGAEGAVYVEARVNGERVPGVLLGGDVTLCDNSPVFRPAATWQWTSAPVTRQRNVVTIHYRYSDPTRAGIARLIHKHMSVHFARR